MKNTIILDVDHGQSRFDCDWMPGLVATPDRLRTAKLNRNELLQLNNTLILCVVNHPFILSLPPLY